jgi:hypothetical protein
MVFVAAIFDVYLPLDILTTVFMLLEVGMNALLQTFLIPNVSNLNMTLTYICSCYGWHYYKVEIQYESFSDQYGVVVR